MNEPLYERTSLVSERRSRPVSSRPASSNPPFHGPIALSSTAISAGVFPLSSLASTDAPAVSSLEMQAREPFTAAQCKGVSCAASLACGEAPCFRRRSIDRASPVQERERCKPNSDLCDSRTRLTLPSGPHQRSVAVRVSIIYTNGLP